MFLQYAVDNFESLIEVVKMMRCFFGMLHLFLCKILKYENSFTRWRYITMRYIILFLCFNVCPSPRVTICCRSHRFAVRAATHYHTRAWQTLKHGTECFILSLHVNYAITISHFTSLVHYTIANSHFTLHVHYTIAISHFTLQIRYLITFSHFTLHVSYTITLIHFTLHVRYTITSAHLTLHVRYTIIISHFTSTVAHFINGTLTSLIFICCHYS